MQTFALRRPTAKFWLTLKHYIPGHSTIASQIDIIHITMIGVSHNKATCGFPNRKAIEHMTKLGRAVAHGGGHGS